MPVASNPSVSIIIPVFNRANYILRSLKSVWAQTYKDYEIIVVDDGSKDNLREVLTPYLHTLRYVYQRNQGVAAARNKGINLARGKWIAFLDSDDIWLPNKLKEQVNWLRINKKSVCFTDIAFINNFFKIRNHDKIFLNDKKKQIKSKPLFLILNEPLYIQTMVIEKRLLNSIGNFNINLSVTEDTDLIYRLINKTDFFLFIKKPLVLIERSPLRKGLTYASKHNLVFSVFSGVRILLNTYLEYNNLNNNYNKSRYIIRLLRKRIGYFLSRKAEILCAYKKTSEAKATALDALYFDPNIKTIIRSFLIILFTSFMRRIYYNKYND